MVVSDYATATRYARDNRRRFIDAYCIDNVLPKILEDVEPRPLEPFSRPYALAMKASQRFANRYFETWALRSKVVPERDRLYGEVETMRHENADLQQRFRECVAENVQLHNRICEIETSEAFKIGRLLMTPPHAAKRLVKRALDGWKGRANKSA